MKESPAKDGKLIALGGFETGFRINPNGGGLPEFDRDYPDVPAREYFLAQAHRTNIHHTSSPLSYRAVMRTSGTIARIGLDFWPCHVDERGRWRSYYGAPPNEGWLWRGHTPALTGPGPDGAVLTTRGQMLLEGLQETELLVQFLRAKQSASPEIVERIDRCLAARAQANLVGDSLSQATISLDWPGEWPQMSTHWPPNWRARLAAESGIRHPRSELAFWSAMTCRRFPFEILLSRNNAKHRQSLEKRKL